ncbi:CULLIN-2 domain-containing protein [Aphelenchoides besseyi]|nr:CULLIN-2 domain-containing protein [Aphelenchoides besseyi]
MAVASVDITTIWAQLEEGLDQIYNHQDRVLVPKYMGLYTGVFNFCTRQCQEDSYLKGNGFPQGRYGAGNQMHSNSSGADFIGADLYSRLREFITVYVANVAKQLVGLHGEDLLEKYKEVWTRFQFSSTVANGIFAYLNRHWIKREIDEGKSDVYEIYNLAILVWNEVLFNELNGKITNALLQLIQQERNAQKISTNLISCVIASYMELGCNEDHGRSPSVPSDYGNRRKTPEVKYGVYRNAFEKPFLQSTRDYYTEESTKFLSQHSVTDYLKKVEQRLKEEHDRCTLYLDSSTLEPLTEACHDVLIRQHLPLIQQEFHNLLYNERDEDLGRMFNLCEHVDGAFDALRLMLEKHVEQKGLEAIERVANTAITDPKQYVNVILEVHQRYSQLVNKTFRSDPGFVQAMDKALTSFVNNNRITEISKSASKSPELLARCCDLLLRKNSRNPEDRELEDLLSQIIIVFKYIYDKDVFQKFYSKMLSKRLVTESSASEESESIMITKLKQLCGFEYTSKLQRMFTDANLSRDITDLFKKSDEGKNCIDMSVMVLTTGVWPITSSIQFEIPVVLQSSVDKFTTFYQNRHNGRRLSFQLASSRGELLSSVFNKRYTFITTVAQISVLMLYNDCEEYSIQEIEEKLKMRRDFLSSSLQVIVKSEVLKCKDGSLECGDATLILNKSFQNKKLKVDLSKVMIKSDVRKENEDVQRSIEDDRRMVVQAAIVRIMKMRKTLKHSQLVSEVLSQLTPRFNPKIPMIKKSIDILIEKEYLKRSTDDIETLEYIA